MYVPSCIDTVSKIPTTLARMKKARFEEENFWGNILRVYCVEYKDILPRPQAYGAPSGQRLAMPSTLAKPL